MKVLVWTTIAALISFQAYGSSSEEWVRVPVAHLSCQTTLGIGIRTFIVQTDSNLVFAYRTSSISEAFQLEKKCRAELAQAIKTGHELIYVSLQTGDIATGSFARPERTDFSGSIRARAISCEYHSLLSPDNFVVLQAQRKIYSEDIGIFFGDPFDKYVRCEAALAQTLYENDRFLILSGQGILAPSLGFYQRKSTAR